MIFVFVNESDFVFLLKLAPQMAVLDKNQTLSQKTIQRYANLYLHLRDDDDREIRKTQAHRNPETSEGQILSP